MVGETARLRSRGDSGAVAQDLARRRRDGSLDLWRGQAPAVPCRIRRPFDQATRHLITISSLALYRMAGRHTLAAVVEQLARERTCANAYGRARARRKSRSRAIHDGAVRFWHSVRF